MYDKFKRKQTCNTAILKLITVLITNKFRVEKAVFKFVYLNYS